MTIRSSFCSPLQRIAGRPMPGPTFSNHHRSPVPLLVSSLLLLLPTLASANRGTSPDRAQSAFPVLTKELEGQLAEAMDGDPWKAWPLAIEPRLSDDEAALLESAAAIVREPLATTFSEAVGSGEHAAAIASEIARYAPPRLPYRFMSTIKAVLITIRADLRLGRIDEALPLARSALALMKSITKPDSDENLLSWQIKTIARAATVQTVAAGAREISSQAPEVARQLLEACLDYDAPDDAFDSVVRAEYRISLWLIERDQELPRWFPREVCSRSENPTLEKRSLAEYRRLRQAEDGSQRRSCNATAIGTALALDALERAQWWLERTHLDQAELEEQARHREEEQAEQRGRARLSDIACLGCAHMDLPGVHDSLRQVGLDCDVPCWDSIRRRTSNMFSDVLATQRRRLRDRIATERAALLWAAALLARLDTEDITVDDVLRRVGPSASIDPWTHEKVDLDLQKHGLYVTSVGADGVLGSDDDEAICDPCPIEQDR